jgi:hypothetical protein
MHQNLTNEGGKIDQANQTQNKRGAADGVYHITLDFSDEKSQHLFIAQQKYSMKKNECFNLKKRQESLQQQISQVTLECEKQKQLNVSLSQKLKDHQSNSSLLGSILDQKPMGKGSQPNLGPTVKQCIKIIQSLEQSHNEQISLINHYKGIVEQRTQFSLEVINKSIKAVEFIKRCNKEDANLSSLAQGSPRNSPPGDILSASYSKPKVSQTEINELEGGIKKCQEDLNNILIQFQTEPKLQNVLTLKQLKEGEFVANLGGSLQAQLNST